MSKENNANANAENGEEETNQLANEQEQEHGEQDPNSEENNGEQEEGQGQEEAQQTKPKTAQGRIQELVAERNASMEYANYWRDQASKMMQQAPQEKKAEKPQYQKLPTMAEFDHDQDKWAEKYAEVVQHNAVIKARQEAEETFKNQQKQSSQQQAQASWQTKMSEFAKEHPDAHTVVSNQQLPITEHMRDAIVDSDVGPAVAYYLGTNPAEAARISQKSAAAQARAIGRIEEKLEMEKKQPKKQGTKAPKPPTPIQGSSAGSVDMEKMSLNEFLDARLKRRGGG